MRKKLGIFLMLFTAACSSNIVSPIELIGKWDNTYEIRNKDENGAWEDWSTINTYALLPQLEFTKDGHILWGGLPSTACCSFREFKVKGKIIELSVPSENESCAAVNCASCDTWSVVKLSDGILELDLCGNSMVRYRRAD